MKTLLIPHDVAPLELVGLGSSSSMDSFASWNMNGSGMEKGREKRDETNTGRKTSRIRRFGEQRFEFTT